MNNIESLIAYHSTDRTVGIDMVHAALTLPSLLPYSGEVWAVISYDIDSASDYLMGLDEEERISEAALALDACGWTVSKINTRRS